MSWPEVTAVDACSSASAAMTVPRTSSWPEAESVRPASETSAAAAATTAVTMRSRSGRRDVRVAVSRRACAPRIRTPSSTSSSTSSGSCRARRLTAHAAMLGLRSVPIALAPAVSPSALAAAASVLRTAMKSVGLAP